MAERNTSPSGGAETPTKEAAGATPAQVPTLTDTQVNAVLTSPLAAVVVVSQAQELVTTLETALAASQPIFVPDFKGLARILSERAVGVVVLDADGNKRVLKAAEKLKAAHPEIAIVVACPRVTAEPFMPLLSAGVVYRVLITPASPGQSRLLVSAALKAHVELMRGRQPVAASKPVAPAPAERRGASLDRRWIAGIAAGLIAVAVVGALLFSREQPPESTPAPPEPAGDQTAAVQSRDEPTTDVEPAEPDTAAAATEEPTPQLAEPSPDTTLLAAADAAFSEGRWFGPDSAFELWSQLAVAEPPVAAARAGLDQLANEQVRRLEQSLVLEQLDRAEAYLDELEANFPDHPRLGFFALQVERERQRQVLAEQSLAEASQALEDAERAETVAELSGRAAAQLEAGNLLEPANESAAALLAEARGTDPSNSEIQRLTRALIAQLTNRFDAAIAAGNLAAASRWQQAIADNGATNGQIQDTRDTLELLRRSQDDDYLAGVRERFAGALESGALLEPAGESARDYLNELRVLVPEDEGLVSLQADYARSLNDAVTESLASESWDSAESWLAALREAPGAEATANQAAGRLERARRQAVLLAEVVPASVLTLSEYEPPEYPRVALQRGQEGYVDLELTVNTAGLPENIIVSGSEPSGVFDAAALEASQGYRFEPYLEDGVAYARRVALRIRFALE